MSPENHSTERPATPGGHTQTLTYNQLRARLIERGTSLRQFALSHGYKPRTVTQAVERWVGRDTLPLGRLTYRILRDLSVVADIEVVPGILDEQPEDKAPLQ